MTTESRVAAAAERGETRAREASGTPWMHLLARAGLCVRGMTYVLVAVLAIRIALGQRGRSADHRGALQQVSDQPFGRIGLVALALGFGGYAAWRLLTVATGEPGTPERDTGRQGVQRIAAAAQGLVYAGLCVSTVGVLAGSGRGDGAGERPAGLTARLLALTGGRPLVLALGAGVVAGGLGLMWWAIREDFEKHLTMHRMSRAVRRVVMPLGMAGYVSRAIVVAFVGASLVDAASAQDPSRARGVDDILRSVAAHPFGRYPLLVAALGLLSFGLYSFVEARYRRLTGD